jgi:hypothetical protein
MSTGCHIITWRSENSLSTIYRLFVPCVYWNANTAVWISFPELDSQGHHRRIATWQLRRTTADGKSRLRSSRCQPSTQQRLSYCLPAYSYGHKKVGTSPCCSCILSCVSIWSDRSIEPCLLHLIAERSSECATIGFYVDMCYEALVHRDQKLGIWIRPKFLFGPHKINYGSSM